MLSRYARPTDLAKYVQTVAAVRDLVQKASR
jgi:hypothetical protein